jgi:hypothetical protein
MPLALKFVQQRSSGGCLLAAKANKRMDGHGQWPSFASLPLASVGFGELAPDLLGQVADIVTHGLLGDALRFRILNKAPN